MRTSRAATISWGPHKMRAVYLVLVIFIFSLTVLAFLVWRAPEISDKDMPRGDGN